MTMLGPVLITERYLDGPLEGAVAGTLPIGYWTVGRQDQLVDPENPDDEVHTYTWTVLVNQRDGSKNEYTGEVEHRYGDGWISLTSKVFQAADLAEYEAKETRAGTTT